MQDQHQYDISPARTIVASFVIRFAVMTVGALRTSAGGEPDADYGRALYISAGLGFSEACCI